MHLAGPLAIAGVDESLAEPGRTAEIHAQDCIAPIGEPLVVGIEAPHVTAPGAAMDQQHHRQSVYRRAATRTAQIRDEREAVACADRHRLHLDQRRALESRSRGKEAARLPTAAIVVEIFERLGVAVIGDEPMPAVL
jgi:hypothetical protein